MGEQGAEQSVRQHMCTAREEMPPCACVHDECLTNTQRTGDRFCPGSGPGFLGDTYVRRLYQHIFMYVSICALCDCINFLKINKTKANSNPAPTKMKPPV